MSDSNGIRDLSAGLLWALCALLVVHDAAVGAWVLHNRRTVGEPITRVRRRRRTRWALLAGLAAVAFLVALAGDGFPKLPAAVALALAALPLALGPGFQDTVVGELGARRGWNARRFEDLEEWRLIGDHLRWKLRGGWIASDLAKEHHPALRAKLLRLAPDRESRFNR